MVRIMVLWNALIQNWLAFSIGHWVMAVALLKTFVNNSWTVSVGQYTLTPCNCDCLQSSLSCWFLLPYTGWAWLCLPSVTIFLAYITNLCGVLLVCEASYFCCISYQMSNFVNAMHQGGRKPWNSINFVCAHDGFTMADLVTYNNKSNLANGEENNDGENHNCSWNCGEVIR